LPLQSLAPLSIESQRASIIITSAEHNSKGNASFFRTWGPLAAIAISYFMTALDTVMLPVATSDIVADLGVPVSAVQATFALVPLAAAATYLTGGKLGDIHGRKKIFRIGLILYWIGELSGLLAPNIFVLIGGWSLVRGIALGLIAPSQLGLIAANYAGRRRNQAFAVVGSLAPLGALVGPLLMGWAARNVSWRLPFGLGLLAILAALLLTRAIGETKIQAGSRLDWAGTALAALGVSLLILGPSLASQSEAIGLPQTLLIAGGGLLSLVLLLFRNRNLAARGGQPLFHLQLFDNRLFATGLLMLLLFFFLLSSIVFVVPVFLQTVAGYDALQSAVAVTPLFLGAVIGGFGSSLLKGRLVNNRYMQLSTVIVGIGLLWLRLVAGPAVSVGQMLGPTLVMGLGFGLGFAQAPNIVLSSVRPKEQGEASGLQTTAQDLGFGLGAAVIGSLFLGLSGGENALPAVVLALFAVVAIDFVVAWLLPNE
jgi:MFS family permease